MINRKQVGRTAAIALALLGAGAAQAHTGHGTSTLLEGLTHPFGLDHLLAMVAVGLWSVMALPSGQTWRGPLTFMSALVLGSLWGQSGMTVPYLEHALALSVVLFGVMIAVARNSRHAGWGLGLVAAAGTLHGLAHGAEAPANGLGAYAVGFLATTAALHIVGVNAGLIMRRLQQERSTALNGPLGAALGAAGLVLFGQLVS